MLIVSSNEKLSSRLGWDPLKSLLAPRIHVDGPGMVTPLLLTVGDSQTLLAREQETGNLLALGVDLSATLFYEPYFTVGSIEAGQVVANTIVDVMASRGVTRVEVEADLPLARYLELTHGFEVDVRGSRERARRAPVTLHRVACNEIIERFREYRLRGCQLGGRIIDEKPQLSGLRKQLTADVDTRFSLLDQKMQEAGIEGVLVGSRVNLEELAGVPGSGAPGFALKMLGDHSVYLASVEGDSYTPRGAETIGAFPSLSAAIRSVAGPKNVGVEETYLSVGEFNDLSEVGLTPRPAASLLARWREERDFEDLGFALVIAAASQYAIEGALAQTAHQIDNGVVTRESDVASTYLGLAERFFHDLEIEADVSEFFTNCHAGDRTIYPSLPTDFPLNGRSKTLKLDAGLRVAIDGVCMATSDVGRTLTRTPEATDAYNEFRRIVRDDVISRLRPGVEYSSAHRWCVESLEQMQPSLVQSGLMPSGAGVRPGYDRRNIGHLMGKQESFVSDFRPESPYRVQVGDIGAAEIQWPYAGHGIAAEDMWVVAAEATYITT